MHAGLLFGLTRHLGCESRGGHASALLARLKAEAPAEVVQQ
ncbi:hypothetical protein [Nonomuraea mesophila]|nr:hypothetical protein [Nonomuraea mesophila]